MNTTPATSTQSRFRLVLKGVLALVLGVVFVGLPAALPRAWSLSSVIEQVSSSPSRECLKSGVSADYEYAFSDGNYRITDVVLSGFAASCEALQATVSLYDDDAQLLGEGTAVFSDEGTVLVPLVTPVIIQDFTRIGVVITDAS